MKDFILDLDKKREIRFGFKALRALRKKWGNKSIEKVLDFHMDEIPALILFGLQWEDKDLTLDKLETILDESIPKKYTIMKLTTIVYDAFYAQLGIDEKKPLASGRKRKVTAKKKVKLKTLSTRKQKPQP